VPKHDSTVEDLWAGRYRPERGGPNRYAPGYFRHSEPSKTRQRRRGTSTVEGGVPMSSPEDVVVYAVRLGYKVAEDQLRKSKNAARRLRKASLASGGGDVGDVLAQGLRMYRRVGELLVEAAETVGSSSRIWSHLYSRYRGESEPAPRSASAQDLNASLGRIADTLAGKVSETLDAPVPKEELKQTLERLAGQFVPTLGALSASGKGASQERSSPVCVAPGPGLAASGTLIMWREVDGQPLQCDGLIARVDGKAVALAASISVEEKEGAWDTLVRITETAPEAVYRGAVHAGGKPVGAIEVVLRKS